MKEKGKWKLTGTGHLLPPSRAMPPGPAPFCDPSSGSTKFSGLGKGHVLERALVWGSKPSTSAKGSMMLRFILASGLYPEYGPFINLNCLARRYSSQVFEDGALWCTRCDRRPDTWATTNLNKQSSLLPADHSRYRNKSGGKFQSPQRIETHNAKKFVGSFGHLFSWSRSSSATRHDVL